MCSFFLCILCYCVKKYIVMSQICLTCGLDHYTLKAFYPLHYRSKARDKIHQTHRAVLLGGFIGTRFPVRPAVVVEIAEGTACGFLISLAPNWTYSDGRCSFPELSNGCWDFDVLAFLQSLLTFNQKVDPIDHTLNKLDLKRRKASGIR